MSIFDIFKKETNEEVCESENISINDARDIWLSNGKDDDYSFGYSEYELENGVSLDIETEIDHEAPWRGECPDCDGTRYMECPQCDGEGGYNSDTCSQCGGDGSVLCEYCEGSGEATFHKGQRIG